MERGTAQKKQHVKPKTKEQRELDRVVEEIDETNFFAAFVSRAKELFTTPMVEGIFFGIGGAIVTFLLADRLKSSS